MEAFSLYIDKSRMCKRNLSLHSNCDWGKLPAPSREGGQLMDETMLNLEPFDPPERLLCGPGPTNVAPSVLAAMRKPMLGHLDPTLHDLLLEIIDLLRAVYRAPEGLVLPLQATGSSGMETGIVNLVEPGETVIVGSCGFFGARITEQARRAGAEVVEVRAGWGEIVPTAGILEALERHPRARLIAIVHAETSSGVEQPIAELAEALRADGPLLMVDCVTSLGGVPVDFAGWGIDYAYSCTQKCLAAPPGMSPIAVSERALERIAARTHPVPFCFDIGLLEAYWAKRPAVYHHTAPILHIYALHEALRLALAEGLECRWNRHAEAGDHLRRGIEARGFELLADHRHRLAPLTAVRLEDEFDAKAVQSRLLREWGIEIGGGLGPQAPPMWRIGLMGENATTATADRLLEALDQALVEREAVVSALACPGPAAVHRVSSRPVSRSIVLGLVGDSGAGKTTLTRGLVRVLGEEHVSHLSGDDYHRYDRARRAELGVTPLDPAANHLDILAQHLTHLRRWEAVLKPVYDHGRGTFAPPVYLRPARFLITEGLHNFHTETLRSAHEIRVFLAPQEDLHRAWKVKRDCTRRGYTTTEALAEIDGRQDDARAYIVPQREHADIVVAFRGGGAKEPPTSMLM